VSSVQEVWGVSVVWDAMCLFCVPKASVKSRPPSVYCDPKSGPGSRTDSFGWEGVAVSAVPAGLWLGFSATLFAPATAKSALQMTAYRDQRGCGRSGPPRTKRDLTGAPCSHQRTWADYELFECFHSIGRSFGWASPPVFFGPRTLVRTWGTRQVSFSPRDLVCPFGTRQRRKRPIRHRF
jgi:hypothetical protein